MTERPAPIARQVRSYLDSHPTLADALRLGVANYSAVARRVAESIGTTQKEAVVAACRRYPKGAGDGTREAGIARVLRKSRIETRTKVATITVRQGADILQRLGDVVEELLDEGALCRVIQVSQGTVVVVDEDSVPRVARALRESSIVRTRKNLIEVAVTSPDSIEETPGLLRHLAGVLSVQGINIVEALSCFTDTVFLVDRSDMGRSIAVLSDALQ